MHDLPYYICMFCVICTCNILAYRMAVHSTAQCIQEDTHRCCCCWQCTSHRSHMGRLESRGRGTVFEDWSTRILLLEKGSLLVCCTRNILVTYTKVVHKTAQCIQEGTHRCCCWQCMSHRSYRGRLEWRGKGTVLENWHKHQFHKWLHTHTRGGATDVMVMHSTHVYRWWKEAGKSHLCLLLSY